jgi:CheY-like chemotaxis protein
MKPRVMVVDDNAANRTAFQSILEGAYTVHLADSGHVALQLSLNHEFALILLDVRMPLMDGFETAALLRARERTRETPIIFLSAYELTVDQIKEAYVAGATDFLPSPVDQELLQFKVAAYVRLYLRNESIRAQLHHLESLVETLQVEANLRVGALEPSFKSKIDQLEGLIGGLHRQLMTSVQ